MEPNRKHYLLKRLLAYIYVIIIFNCVCRRMQQLAYINAEGVKSV